MLDLNFENEFFDLVVSDQVLEHVGGDPFKAIAESYRVLKPGGIAIHTSCLLYQIHGYPNDYWRFTPDGFRLLCHEFNEVIEADGWGNRYYWLLNWLGLVNGINVPSAPRHPLAWLASFNEPSYLVSTWVVARK